ncbi:ATP-binding protein, partial [Pseudomonas cannabina]
SLADVGALTYRKVDCDLSELLESIAAMFEERFAKRQLEMHLELPAQRLIVHADPRRLQQLISNLLENSVRYTDVGGRVNVRATTDGDEVCVEVRDSGPGVEPEQLARLFERFYRGETSRNRASGGAGLGLAICHSIALAHGGTLNADHSPTGGLWLTLRLPGRL